MSIVALAGHVSPDTAHLTYAYPFGRTRYIRREWIEQATSGSARGQSRFVTQTTVKAFNVAYTERIAAHGESAANAWAENAVNDGTARWNAPKPSTYSVLAVMVQEPLPDGSGRIGTSFRSLGVYATPEQIAAFSRLAGDNLEPRRASILRHLTQTSQRQDASRWAALNEPEPIAAI